MSAGGWVKLHRVLADYDLWLGEPFTRGQAWVDLLLLANHKAGHIRRRGIKIPVGRGQVGYAQEALANRWKWSKGKVIRFLSELKRDERISQEMALKNLAVSSLICITNYDQYQCGSTEDGTEDGTKNRPKTEPKTVPEQEGKEEKEKTIVPFSEIIDYLNAKTGKRFRSTEPHKRHIHARWKEGYSVDEFKAVIDSRAAAWGTDKKMAEYLRPETLFGSKFDSYLQISREAVSAPSLVKEVFAPTTAEESARLQEVMASYGC